MSNIELKTNKSGKLYYYVTHNKKHYRVSVSHYGKYAENIANKIISDNIRLKNWYEEFDDYIKIFTYQNEKYYEILIDKEDYPKIKDYYWGIFKSANEVYACTNIKDKTVYMHRLIMNVTDPKDIVDHIKGNGIDNRKCNLRITDIKGNSQNRVNAEVDSETGILGVSVFKPDSNGNPNAYVAQYKTTSGERIRRQFAVSVFGKENALKLAIECRKQMKLIDDRKKFLEYWDSKDLREYYISKNKSGLLGVIKTDDLYSAFYIDKNKKRKSKSFSISKYGEDKAKELALKARLLMEELDDNTKFNDEWKKRNK